MYCREGLGGGKEEGDEKRGGGWGRGIEEKERVDRRSEGETGGREWET